MNPVATGYRAPKWLPGGHAQTIYPLLIKPQPYPYLRERWETPDDDFIDIWDQTKDLVALVDAKMEEQGKPKMSFFEVLIESRQNFLGDASEHLTISPGMAADASIQTGKRTMMEYMLKPIVMTLDKSLRER